jgi:hypothetical protein
LRFALSSSACQPNSHEVFATLLCVVDLLAVAAADPTTPRRAHKRESSSSSAMRQPISEAHDHHKRTALGWSRAPKDAWGGTPISIRLRWRVAVLCHQLQNLIETKRNRNLELKQREINWTN